VRAHLHQHTDTDRHPHTHQLLINTRAIDEAEGVGLPARARARARATSKASEPRRERIINPAHAHRPVNRRAAKETELVPIYCTTRKGAKIVAGLLPQPVG